MLSTDRLFQKSRLFFRCARRVVVVQSFALVLSAATSGLSVEGDAMMNPGTRFCRSKAAGGVAFFGPSLGLILTIVAVAVGCRREAKEQESVVVYTALDQQFSAPIFEQFTRETGIEVRAKYDTESQKTVGLTQDILAERDRPQ